MLLQCWTKATSNIVLYACLDSGMLGQSSPWEEVFYTFFPPPFLNLSFYFELGFYLSRQRQINSVFCRFGGLCEVHGAPVCVRLRLRKKGRRSGGPERNEGVQGQSEGTDLLSQLADEELIRGEETVLPQREKGRKRRCPSLNCHRANILFGLPSLILTSLLSKTAFWDVSQ